MQTRYGGGGGPGLGWSGDERSEQHGKAKSELECKNESNVW